MRIQLLRADRTSIVVDAIVNPAAAEPPRPPQGSPEDLAARDRRHRAPSGLANAPVGAATATSGGNLLCRFVIHAVVPPPGDPDIARKLAAATTAALDKAEELAISSVGVPPLGLDDESGMTLEQCAQVMIGATIAYRLKARSLQRVVYCLFGSTAYDAFARALEELDH